MRPIDADELITIFSGGEAMKSMAESIHDERFVDALRKAPTVEMPEPARWIPVEECLPETIACIAGTAYSEAVIVWTTGKKAMIAVWDGEDFISPADFWEAEGEYITHWMPLPTPPKEEPANG